ncbi:uncharacterized protein LOC113283008 [Papaver somniferum]|uniref:uncharacterized protein LOC113283008 n=1 Tax=Papaver somniferum TaxID=3469 RepID=UPI000E70161A|nr:uncharacterized protein LOC113283008 [Papaver somniferum]
MYGHHHHLSPGGGPPGVPPPSLPPSQQQQPQYPQQFSQNPNFYFQNPNFYPQNPSFSVPPQNPYIQNPSFPIRPNPPPFPLQQQHPNTSAKPKESLERIESAVVKAHNNLLTTGETVSAWLVAQSALLILKVDYWGSLGFQMQQVPSLHRLMVIEGKINAFIHCFVGSRRIISLYDLSLAICKNEGIERFEDLRLGSLLRHPLVVHYFSVPVDTKEVHKITSQEVISYLADYLYSKNGRFVQAEGFLEFLAIKESVDIKEKLGVRIQSLKLHITSIQGSKRAEESTLMDYVQILEQKSNLQNSKAEAVIAKAPCIHSQKKELDKRFSTIAQRIKSFSPIQADLDGKHIRFLSSDSEAESDENDADDEVGNKDEKSLTGNHGVSSQDRQSSGKRATTCPYPSASEEMTRLGLKIELDEPSPASGTSKCNTNKKSMGKKRKGRYFNSGSTPPSSNFSKRSKLNLEGVDGNMFLQNDAKTELINNSGSEDVNSDLMLNEKMMDTFITTWKDACQMHSVAEVFERMIDFYNEPGRVGKKSKMKCSLERQKKKMKSTFSSYPCIGLLNIAIKSIKCGMWDNLYDAIQSIGQHGCSSPNSASFTDMERIDVEVPTKKDASSLNEHASQLKHSVSIGDISKKIVSYFEYDSCTREGRSEPQKQLNLLRSLCDCELWLTQQFSVKEFDSLGYGNFIKFLEDNFSSLPNELYGNMSGNSLLEVSMLGQQLIMLLSQSKTSLWGNDAVTSHDISLLLKKQFPTISFQVGGDDPSKYLKEQEKSQFSSCVLFSVALSQSWYELETRSLQTQGNQGNTELNTDLGHISGARGSVSSKDAVDCLLSAPMLSDLLLWSHWDLLFAPSLGPLVDWLLSEANTKELLCVVTTDGKIIRIDRTVTVNDFLVAALQGSSFQTAVKLLSLLSLSGGEKQVPLSLLKCHAHQAIQVILKNSVDSLETGNDRDVEPHGQDKGIPAASRFILECLGYLPSEFWSFAANLFLSGLRSFTKEAHAHAAILLECNQLDQRMMLHEIGFSLGIMEWIADYHALKSSAADGLPIEFSNLGSSAAADVAKGSAYQPKYDGEVAVIVETDVPTKICSEFGTTTDLKEVSNKKKKKKKTKEVSNKNINEHDEDKEATLVIESIRREEFGLVPDLTHAETSMLKKHHARLGRALHCLSQELYSQDSHFLLELVQNADDNVYSESVEPTLVFILQETGIVVLNNERGFSAQNIRALCDVGNSTKRGASAGYIGQKGIGFKSVFRVTDAPEIHSKGFHVKFDISEGQIGFVLPEVVSPCDIDLYGRLVPGDVVDQNNVSSSSWKTCIILPFKPKLKEGTSISSIVSMFSDLHPSLLLFLHRLRCIKFKNMLTKECVVLRRETLEDGIVKISHGKEKLSWFVASQKLHGSVLRPDVQTTEISIAFTLDESADGQYKPHLEQQPVFAFLPLRTYGLKFILQGDFVLPSSREEVDGNSAWNQWLLSEFPSLFVGAQRSFCALPCFQGSPGKAVVAYMSFVPLVGEVHGFFAHLPRMIISKLRISNCMLLEGHDKNDWVPPCRALRGWDEQARILLPESLLNQHLGLGYLDKDIVLSDTLAKALGVQGYGPNILIDIISSICLAQDNTGIKSLGLDWLSSFLNTLYSLLVDNSFGSSISSNAVVESSDHIKRLRQIRFIPLSDGTYSSVAEDTIWLPSESFNSGLGGSDGPDVFPSIYANLRMVSSALISLATANNNGEDPTLVENRIRMLNKIGVQRLSAHDVIMVHILPGISDVRVTNRDNNLMAEYLSFVMLHLQSNCPRCCNERGHIISELRNKTFISTSYGYKRLVDVPIHFSQEFGNPIDVNNLIDATSFKWHEIDIIYLKCGSTNKASMFDLAKWREFLQELGVSDFVQITQVERKVADVPLTDLKSLMHATDLIPFDSVLKDWESPELVQLVSALSSQNNNVKCKYLLEVLDEKWDNYFGLKASGCCTSKQNESDKLFKSSFIKSITDIPWVVSSMDQELHYPKDLFHDCDTIRSLLGASVPYVLPQVKSRKFVSDMGFKTQVTLDDALQVLQVWRRCASPFKTSIAQMSKYYSVIWNEMDSSKSKIAAAFSMGPSIFVPLENISRHDDVVHGMLLSQDDVYWHDPTGSVDLARKLLLQSGSINKINCHLSNTLAQVYQGLHDFFVHGCRVSQTPPFRSYILILMQLSDVALPSQAAKVVYEVILKWSDDLKSGLLSPEDVLYLKEFLLKLESTVLPTVLDKWVSLHPTFGVVCWCDDEELKKQFKHSDNISFLYFGELSNAEKKMLSEKISGLMQSIGVPALSEVITREAIFYGVEDNKDKASLVDWILPFAQRYISKMHPDKYFLLKQAGSENMSRLQVVVVDKLFYKYTIKGGNSASNRRSECSCLIQGEILYVSRDSDTHSIFLELSRLFYNGIPELHLANFLHMVTTMAESGSTKEQTEFFILNSQKIPKLPDSEPIWCLPLLSSPQDVSQPACSSAIANEQNQSKSKRKLGYNTSWPPADWKTAPDFNYSRTNGLRTRPGDVPLPIESSQKEEEPEGMVSQDHDGIPLGYTVDWNIESVASLTVGLQESTSKVGQPRSGSGRSAYRSEVINQTYTVNISGYPDFSYLAVHERDQISHHTPNPTDAQKTGRRGEEVAFDHLVEKFGAGSVNWVNKEAETGLPYDIVVCKNDESKEYIEVKATTSARKDWFSITPNEWQFAVEKGDSFSVVYVVLLDSTKATITHFNNPLKQCRHGSLQLALLIMKKKKNENMPSAS